MKLKKAQEAIDLKMKVAEKYIEEKLNPLLEVDSLGKKVKRPFSEWSQREIELARQLYGDKVVRLRQVKDYDKKVSQLEAEVEEMENG